MQSISITVLKDGRHCRVDRSISMPNYDLCVTPGFLSDYASVPRLLWWLCSPAYGKYVRAAIIHDYLYARLGLVKLGNMATYAGGLVLTRRACDKEFFDTMKVDGVGIIRRHYMYYGVRLFGWYAWLKHKRKQSYA